MTYESLETVNKNIDSKKVCGYEFVIAQTNGYRLLWSNAQMRWTRAYYRVNKGDKMYIDGGIVFVKQTKKTIDKWINEGLLNVHPCYKDSFEGRMRKISRSI